jgi:hypothetical protein
MRNLGRVRAADDLKKVAQLRRIARPEARAVAERRPLPVSRNSADARAMSSAGRELRHVERREHPA